MPGNVGGSFTAEQLQTASSKTVIFGHQSVGSDVIQGLRELMSAEPRLRLKIIREDTPGPVADGHFIEFSIGQNGDPLSKDRAFAAALENIGDRRAVVMYKYCYVDMRESTDVRQLFRQYRENVDMLRSNYPSMRFVHVTMPLTTVESALKAMAKKALRRNTQRDIEVKRNEFNELLRQAFQDKDVLFDLAEAESTRPDGSRTYFTRDGKRIYVLAPEFTTDGGHLNALGSRAVAARLVRTLASF